MEEVVNNVIDQAIAEMRKASQAAIYRQDIALWAKDILGIHLWSKQREICESVVNNPHTAVRSCHGSGKSLTASIIACWWVATHPVGQAIVVTTAPTYAQIHSVLWREIGKHHELAKSRGNPLPGYITISDKWQIPMPDSTVQAGFGRKPADNNMHAFNGIHEKYVLVLVDEACGINENLFTAVEAITTTANSRILAIGNPDDPNTYFGKMFNDVKVSPEWHHISISAFDSPNLTRGQGIDDDIPDELRPFLIQESWVEQHKRMWGEDSPRYASKVLGEFPTQSANSLFSQGTIDKGVHTVVKPDRGKRPVLGVDVARFGDDYSTIYSAEEGTVWRIDNETGAELGPLVSESRNHLGFRESANVRGKQVRFLKAKSKADGVEVANWIHQTALETMAGEVRIDISGLGAPIKDMVQLRSEGSYKVIGMNGSGPTPDRYRWRNSRAWWHDDLRQQMDDGKIDIDYDDGNLKDELLGIQYHFKNNWRSLQIESKEDMASRGIKSPDYSDAAIYAAAPIEQLLNSPLAYYDVGDKISFDPAEVAGIAGMKYGPLGAF